MRFVRITPRCRVLVAPTDCGRRNLRAFWRLAIIRSTPIPRFVLPET